MTRFTEVIREWFGWCPMAAGGKQEPAGSRMTVTPDKDTAGAGPVERRTALFLHLALAVVGLSWIIGIAALPYLPETIPVHWNIYGEPDGFAGRFAGTFGLPAIITLVALLLVVLPRFDRMQETFDESRDIYTIVVFCQRSASSSVSMLPQSSLLPGWLCRSQSPFRCCSGSSSSLSAASCPRSGGIPRSGSVCRGRSGTKQSGGRPTNMAGLSLSLLAS